MVFGERLRMARRKAGLTQKQLGDAVGMTKGSISGLENGSSKNPSAGNLLPIAKALGVNPEWLLTGKGNMRPPTPIDVESGSSVYDADGRTIDIAGLISSATPRTRQALTEINAAANAGKLTDDDVELLNAIAKRLAHD